MIIEDGYPTCEARSVNGYQIVSVRYLEPELFNWMRSLGRASAINACGSSDYGFAERFMAMDNLRNTIVSFLVFLKRFYAVPRIRYSMFGFDCGSATSGL